MAQGGWGPGGCGGSVTGCLLLLTLLPYSNVGLLQGSTMATPWAAQHYGAWSTFSSSFSPSSSHLGVTGLFLTHFYLSPHCQEVFCPFLNAFSLRCQHRWSWAQLCPAQGLLRNWLELVGAGRAQRRQPDLSSEQCPQPRCHSMAERVLSYGTAQVSDQAL